MAIALTLSSSD